ncbi:MAG: hypothetical protein EZS28_010889 [Streblomastix strix]|uniref:DNA-directed DNA polymerase n=1 Tax=Streblomastix strix TaxID=222440 RepID=A0A5J4WG23_9EUKA|nr:MAG: hypothetical protein EZS28_010889 [Streblomastix strix]
MASCANGTKFKMCCDNLDLNSRYTTKDDPALIQFNPFELTQEHQNMIVASYNMQDTNAGRGIKDIVKESDFEYFREMIQGGQCWFCEVRFTIKNPSTLDRIDNSLGNSKNNVQLACSRCNDKRRIRDPNITKGLIQLKRYFFAKGLPMPLTDEETYHKLRPNITGGLANAFHRYNVKDETHINKLKLEGQYIVSYDLDYVMTHVTGYDFNSLYPSVMSGIKHDFIKQIDVNQVHLIHCETDSMMLVVTGDPKQNYKLNLAEFVDEIQISNNDNELPVITENVDNIQYGGKTIQDCKSQEDIEKALQNLVSTQNVIHIRGDGEKGFADSVIRTIRNAFGQDDRLFSNLKLMQQMLEINNDTPYGAFDNKFIPKQVNSLQELEGYCIRKNDKKLREVKLDQKDQGFTRYKPGNIQMIHVDYLRTKHRYMKQRRNFNELAKFIKYDNGNVEWNRAPTELAVIPLPLTSQETNKTSKQRG